MLQSVPPVLLDVRFDILHYAVFSLIFWILFLYILYKVRIHSKSLQMLSTICINIKSNTIRLCVAFTDNRKTQQRARKMLTVFPRT